MLPLYLLNSAKSQPILVELKNGETLNGLLTNCDSWMNLTLSEVIQTSPNAEVFTKIPEIYIRGSHIKYLRLPEQTMDYAKEQNMINMEQRNKNQNRRGGRPNNNSGNFNRRRNDNNRGGNYNNRRGNSSNYHQSHGAGDS
ncbi:hypothetical protein PSN45_000921 [Yamadazyma tenuis]|uniref:LSM complex subunit LSM4 n=1 Tax=Candida tenuis (strain ATCC 10573 / BCRC 21748 / CBS 615 / JCM 9827 / NBRC 10315 / NRRL Y-1498 / VKM Y-70) TaxID=590646 RepID=G3BBP2_CANTC|nr:Sm-like ribonucleoprotein [Yamadazyma tenuis ATCC 10573]EGV62200.1 Sm-like ribonucleoprotein [Yamadazyma tenuis ATCC 10573]WEJ93458.1 hypothetical protein PSN45_000921 [Yamadazyma tenuis]